ncbi:hypothetical protein [Glutamicibacter ardleyensis]|uniref:Head decoration protein n=1 Tax=Glutamicibacter ardleyensis TaxID=225894 RepID=A0ABQ2DF70_9MICC|nr:hypothetical protein [Glutamicibacter ardleyensis]GGJ55626.1 hypothetical protein GCM10007173_13000 [Glutamicibacter ardleyensis]
MPIQTTAQKNTLATAYGAAATHGAVYTTAPGATAGTEPTGVYARKPLTWSAPANGVITASATFDIPSGVTVVGTGVHSALTAGTYLDGEDVTAQAFASQGTLTVNYTYTQE